VRSNALRHKGVRLPRQMGVHRRSMRVEQVRSCVRASQRCDRASRHANIFLPPRRSQGAKRCPCRRRREFPTSRRTARSTTSGRQVGRAPANRAPRHRRRSRGSSHRCDARQRCARGGTLAPHPARRRRPSLLVPRTRDAPCRPRGVAAHRVVAPTSPTSVRAAEGLTSATRRRDALPGATVPRRACPPTAADRARTPSAGSRRSSGSAPPSRTGRGPHEAAERARCPHLHAARALVRAVPGAPPTGQWYVCSSPG